MIVNNFTSSVTLSPNIPAHSDIYEETQTFKVGRDPRSWLDQTPHSRERVRIPKCFTDFPPSPT